MCTNLKKTISSDFLHKQLLLTARINLLQKCESFTNKYYLFGYYYSHFCYLYKKNNEIIIIFYLTDRIINNFIDILLPFFVLYRITAFGLQKMPRSKYNHLKKVLKTLRFHRIAKNLLIILLLRYYVRANNIIYI